MKMTNTEMNNFVKVMLIHGANLIEKKILAKIADYAYTI